MKKVLLSLTIAALAGMSLSAGSKDTDPVLMTVNKKPVKLSEFSYLYQKNNAQQLATQPVDEYLDLFVVYKLKVADAEAAGIADNDAFVNEYAGYKRDLSEPYLANQQARDSLVRSIYDRLKTEVDVSHIMVERPFGAKASAAKRAMLDSLRTEIIAGRADFAQVADAYSIDPGVKTNHGHMGYIVAGMFPYTFEDAAYTTAVGEISPVIETQFGYHIVKVNDVRDALGQVKVQHILKLTRGLSEEEQLAKKAAIDSLYTVLVNGGDFDAIAKAESEDPGSARDGGNLEWFSTGRMVPEFEKVSFELKNGEISKPFPTAYGYHIVKRLDWKQIDPYEEMAPRINAMIDRDDRQYIPVRAQNKILRAKYHTKIDRAIADDVRKIITSNGRFDTTLEDGLVNDDRVIISLDGDNGEVTVGDIFAALPAHFNAMSPDDAIGTFDKRIEEVADEVSMDAERENLAQENAEYRNLLNEYRDGMLLFEISDRNVWTRSKEDAEGIKAFFNANKAKYATWTAPKFKGYIVFATSDSIKDAAQNFIAANNIANENLVEALRGEFGKDIKVERVLAAEGDNAIIDGIAFGKP
ncbi:MAG: peptidylprolyl isomerase, partial [Muribaculaceae bacterium]|nr:peptidylprolyl isomerase [Muribaculaceae bacterium]